MRSKNHVDIANAEPGVNVDSAPKVPCHFPRHSLPPLQEHLDDASKCTPACSRKGVSLQGGGGGRQ